MLSVLILLGLLLGGDYLITSAVEREERRGRSHYESRA